MSPVRVPYLEMGDTSYRNGFASDWRGGGADWPFFLCCDQDRKWPARESLRRLLFVAVATV